MRRPSTFRFVLAGALAALSLSPAAAQEAAEAAPESAASLFAAGDFAGAARVYRQLTEADPEDAAAWFGLGRALYSARQVDPAIEAYAKALELGFQPPWTMLHLARGHAVKGNDDEALGWIEKAAATGAGIFQAITTLEEFHRFFGNDRFQAVVEEIRPCNSPAYHLLDFWVGTWQVVDARGQTVGSNSILKILNGCAVIENWKSAGGSEGKSLFYHHEGEGLWKQVWVTDGQGLKEKHMIAARGGAVRFQGELRRADGSVILDRTTLMPTEDGKVRQVIEQSTDGGDTWQVGFDAYYVRE